MDYQGNSKSEKDISPKADRPKPEKIVTGEVVSRKKPLSRKFKDLFINADIKSVGSYIFSDVLIPAARNLIVDATNKGVERMMYGDRAVSRRSYGGGRITYNSPVERGSRELQSRGYRPSAPSYSRSSSIRQNSEDLVLASREEAELVLERLSDIVNQYSVASVADLNDLVGLPTSHTDNKWGWEYLSGTTVRQVRDGYLIDFPPAEPI